MSGFSRTSPATRIFHCRAMRSQLRSVLRMDGRHGRPREVVRRASSEAQSPWPRLISPPFASPARLRCNRVVGQLCRKQQSAAATPVDLADALCTRARAEAATSQRSKAVRTLSRAARITPWYARVAIVRQILGAAAPIPDLPSIDVAAESRLFDDPWAAPET